LRRRFVFRSAPTGMRSQFRKRNIGRARNGEMTHPAASQHCDKVDSQPFPSRSCELQKLRTLVTTPGIWHPEAAAPWPGQAVHFQSCNRSAFCPRRWGAVRQRHPGILRIYSESIRICAFILPDNIRDCPTGLIETRSGFARNYRSIARILPAGSEGL